MDINLQEKNQRQPKKSKTAIYVDDNRVPTELPEGYNPWIVVKDYKEFTTKVLALYREHKQMPELFSFDHDLTQEYIEWYFTHPNEKIIDYGEFKTQSGLHCAKWLFEACAKNEVSLQTTLFAVHSHNEAGAANILEYINEQKSEKWGFAYANAFRKNWQFEYDQKAVQKQQKDFNNGIEEVSQEGSTGNSLIDQDS